MVTKLIIGWTLIALVLLTSCLSPEAQDPTGNAGLAPATPARPSATPVSVALDEPPTPSMTPQVRQTPSATPTLSPTPTTTATPTVTPTATPTALPTATLSPLPIRTSVCDKDPTLFDLQSTLGMTTIVAADFRDAHTLQIDGWIPRQLSNRANDVRAPRWIFSRVLIDMVSGQITPIDTSHEGLLQSPCPQCAGTEILDRSPDGQWQIIITTAGSDEGVGLWLVSVDTMTRLLPDMPTHLKWVWADDNSLLWLTFYTPEYSATPEGHFFLTVKLGPVPALTLNTDLPQEYAFQPLQPWQYALAFSPVERQALSIADGPWNDDYERFFLYDSAATPPELLLAGGPIVGLRAAFWDRARDTFLLVVVDEEVINFQTIDGAIWLQLQSLDFTHVFPLSDESLDHFFYPQVVFALSADGQRLAMGYGQVEGLAVFDCTAGK